MVDKSYLAKLMLEWEQKKRELDELETAIEDSVLQLEETQQVGNVKASYYGGRKRYDYKTVGEDAPASLQESYTKTTVKVDWRNLVLEGMAVDKAKIPFTQSDPSVSLKLTG